MNTNGNINNNTDDENTWNTRLGITILSKYFEYISFCVFKDRIHLLVLVVV